MGRRQKIATPEAKKIWTDLTIPTNGLAIAKIGLTYPTLRKLFGPSGRLRMSAEKGKRMQRASVRVRTKGRMPQREALAIWRDPTLTTREAVTRMRGWSMRTAYMRLGNRGVPTGRRHKDKTVQSG